MVEVGKAKVTKLDNLTVTVYISKIFKLKIRIALFLFKLASIILGCSLRIERSE